MYIYTYIYIFQKIYIYIPKWRPHQTFSQVLVKDLTYAGLNTSKWALFAADMRSSRTTLRNLGTNRAKLMAAACASAATADLARDLALSVSRRAVADTEAARTITLKQVETATRAAAAAATTAPTSIASARGGKRKGGVGWGTRQGEGVQIMLRACAERHWPHECAFRPQAEWRWLTIIPLSVIRESQTHYVHVFDIVHTFLSACTHACFLWVDMCLLTYFCPSSRTYYYAHTHIHAYTNTPSHTSYILATRSPWNLKNVKITNFTTKSSQCICSVSNTLVSLYVC